MAADRTLGGYEVMHMLRNGQVAGAPRGDIRAQVRFIENAVGIAAEPPGDHGDLHFSAKSDSTLQQNPLKGRHYDVRLENNQARTCPGWELELI